MEEKYLRPDYSEEEEVPYDSGPSEDDDDIEDDYNPEQEDEGIIENYLDKQDKLNREYMQTSGAFNNGGGANNNNNTSPWNNGNNGGSNTGWGNSWGKTTNSAPWNNGNTWNNSGSSSTSWGNNTSNNNNGKQEIDRKKKVIFCDVLDCLVETFQSNGKPGLLPRGIYDVRLRFEVWDKLGIFSPERIYAMVPRCLLNSSNGSDSWRVMLEYVICSLSEYLRLPYMNCQVLTQTAIGQPKEDMIESILSGGKYKIPKEDVVQIGIESGMYGQNNRDQLAAQKCGIDYIDLGQLMTNYW